MRKFLRTQALWSLKATSAMSTALFASAIYAQGTAPTFYTDALPLFEKTVPHVISRTALESAE